MSLCSCVRRGVSSSRRRGSRRRRRCLAARVYVGRRRGDDVAARGAEDGGAELGGLEAVGEGDEGGAVAVEDAVAVLLALLGGGARQVPRERLEALLLRVHRRVEVADGADAASRRALVAPLRRLVAPSELGRADRALFRSRTKNTFVFRIGLGVKPTEVAAPPEPYLPPVALSHETRKEKQKEVFYETT